MEPSVIMKNHYNKECDIISLMCMICFVSTTSVQTLLLDALDRLNRET